MPGWGKLVAGAIIGAAGAIYATNDELRKGLPGAARDLPDTVRRRFHAATAAAREASALRRAEILKELEAHGAESSRRLGAPGNAAPRLPAVEDGLPEASPRAIGRTDAPRTEPVAPAEE